MLYMKYPFITKERQRERMTREKSLTSKKNELTSQQSSHIPAITIVAKHVRGILKERYLHTRETVVSEAVTIQITFMIVEIFSEV